MRTLTIDWPEFESAIDMQSSESRGYLDVESGKVFVVANETAGMLEDLLAEAGADCSAESVIAEADLPDWEKKELHVACHVEEHLGERLIGLEDVDLSDDHRDLVAFTAAVQDGAVRLRLEKALTGAGAFRRFRDVVHNTFRERQQWDVFQQQRRREKATAWLSAHGIAVQWALPAPVARSEPRAHLLTGVLKFTRTAAQLSGVKRIALVGSLARSEPEPKDADMLVTVSDAMDLTALAKAGRQLAGHGQQLNRGADVFLANERGEYIGRTCSWKDCGRGIRPSCDALHCGRRHYLHDDLRVICLAKDLIAAPPVELWPQVNVRVPVPSDVEELVLSFLRAPPAA